MINLTMKKVLINGQKAIDAERLQAQKYLKLGTSGPCSYKEGKYSCIIGAAIPPYKYTKRLEGKFINRLLAAKLVKIPSGEVDDMERLQRAHDEVLSDYYDRGQSARYDNFIKLFNSLKLKYNIREKKGTIKNRGAK